MRLKTILSLLTLLATAAFQAEAKACPIEKTVYRLKGFAKTATLRFVKDSDLARQTELSGIVTSAITGNSYKFYIAISNGYSTHYLIDASRAKPETDDDLKDIEDDTKPSYAFYNFNKSLRTMGLPNPGEPGPAYIFIPELGPKLWYAEMSAAQKTREAIETELWQRAECAK